MVPTHVHRILRLPAEVRARHDASSMANLLVAGAPFPQQAKRELIDWLGPVVWEYLASTEGMVSMASSADALSTASTGSPDPASDLDAASTGRTGTADITALIHTN
jgi:long-chain acyl-CoA synthetase